MKEAQISNDKKLIDLEKNFEVNEAMNKNTFVSYNLLSFTESESVNLLHCRKLLPMKKGSC